MENKRRKSADLGREKRARRVVSRFKLRPLC